MAAEASSKIYCFLFKEIYMKNYYVLFDSGDAQKYSFHRMLKFS